MNSHEFVGINSVHNLFMKVHEKISWFFTNYYDLIQFMASSWKFMRDSFMNCDEFLWARNLNSFHRLFMKVYELWWMSA